MFICVCNIRHLITISITGARWCSTSSNTKQRLLHVHNIGIVTFQTNIWIKQSALGIYPHLSVFIMD